MKNVEVAYLPECDVCHEYLARYDGPTRLGPHGYMCPDCFGVVGFEDSSINRRLFVRATHHGPWCDEEDAIPEELCGACQPPGAVQDRGLWLLARLAAHWEYNRRLPKNRQAPLDGFELNGADWMEVAALELALGRVRSKP